MKRRRIHPADGTGSGGDCAIKCNSDYGLRCLVHFAGRRRLRRAVAAQSEDRNQLDWAMPLLAYCMHAGCAGWPAITIPDGNRIADPAAIARIPQLSGQSLEAGAAAI